MLRTVVILPKYWYIILFHVYCSDELGEYMESKGATSPGILTLTTSLSKPFTRLDRYPALLKELDRHMQVNFYSSVVKCFKFKFINDKNNNIIPLSNLANLLEWSIIVFYL